MKIPFLPIHILTAKRLEEELLTARAEGKGFSELQIVNLLDDNARLRIFVKEMQRKWKKRGF